MDLQKGAVKGKVEVRIQITLTTFLHLPAFA